MEINLKKEEISLYEHFPELNIDYKKEIIWGTLKYSCFLKNSNKRELLHSQTSPKRIHGSHEIEITLIETDIFGFPKVFERSNKINNFIIKNNLHQKMDDHIYSDNSLCLGILCHYKWSSMINFIYELIIPYFFWYGYYAKNGEPPYKGFSHGHAGFNEYMSEYKQKNVRNKKCYCGSGKKYKICCGFQNFERNLLLK